MNAVTLRPIRASDAEAMAQVLADPALYRFTGGEPPTLEGLRRTYDRWEAGRSPDGTQEWLNWVVLDADARPVGHVQATVTQASAEVAWVIGSAWQGRGYATAATRLALDELRDRGVHRVVAHVHPDHAASAAVARRVGMHETEEVVEGERRWVCDL